MKKIIGVIPLYDDEKQSYWMLPGYIKMLESEGAIPIILPLTDNKAELDFFLEICEGFLLTGGQDVSPVLYNAEKSPLCGKECSERDNMEAYILDNAVKLDKSVLGICRGIQFMNVFYGGSLYQDINTEYNGGVEHCMTPPYDREVHTVSIKKGSALHAVLGAEKIGVNSYHHQAIKDLSDKLEAVATSQDGLTEAVTMPDKRFVLGVQWHPELSYKTDEYSKKIVKAFVNSIKQ